MPAVLTDKTALIRQRRKSSIGVILPQEDPVLGAAREHPVGLIDTTGHQVVHQHADVRFIAI